MIDTQTILATLDKLAADHPGTYTVGDTTPHKAEAGMSYSYDDCLIGCLIREVDPELHAEILEYEKDEADSFQLGTESHTETRHAHLQRQMRELFGPAFPVLRDAQARQDGFNAYSAKPEPERWEDIVKWVHGELDA